MGSSGCHRLMSSSIWITKVMIKTAIYWVFKLYQYCIILSAKLYHHNPVGEGLLSLFYRNIKQTHQMRFRKARKCAQVIGRIMGESGSHSCHGTPRPIFFFFFFCLDHSASHGATLYREQACWFPLVLEVTFTLINQQIVILILK